MAQSVLEKRNNLNNGVDLEKQKALFRLEHISGSGSKKGRTITDEDVHRAGDGAVKEIANKLGVKLK